MEGSVTTIASLDLGSHTARLLVWEWTAQTGAFRTLLRERAYIRLARDFEEPEVKCIKPEATERTLQVLDGFASRARELGVERILAVATGVVREALNQQSLLAAIQDRTGLSVRVISGEEEAFLTGLGVLHAVQVGRQSYVVFDLGGGTTEFLVGRGEERKALSLPLGAAIATQRHLKSDPPDDTALAELDSEALGILRKTFTAEIFPGEGMLIGTGGTVTTLAALVHEIPGNGISLERMNGLTLSLESVRELFLKMKRMTIPERMEVLRLDPGRADVILAGCAIVLSIMRTLGSLRLTVSLSDLLEGILLDHISKCGSARPHLAMRP